MSKNRNCVLYLMLFFTILFITILSPFKTEAATVKKAVTIKTQLTTTVSSTIGSTLKIGASVNTPSKLTYKTSNTKLATVSSDGTVKTLAAGTAKITITATPKSTRYKKTTKVLTVRVAKPVTYKVVYHYSELSKNKTVTRIVSGGNSFQLASASSLNFTNNNHYLIGWNAYVKSKKKWKVYDKTFSTISWGTNKKYLYTYEVGDTFDEEIKTGDELHLYGHWINLKGIHIEEPYFQSYRTKKSSGLIDSTAVIQKALDYGKNFNTPITVKIPAGTYYISKALRVYSNTTLSLDSKATIRRTTSKDYMLMVGNPASKVGGYKQAKNITVKGGTWIGNLTNTSYYEYAVMRFNHCKDITVQGCNIENFSGKHGIIFAGVYNGTIQNVVLEDQTPNLTVNGYPYKQASKYKNKTPQDVLSHSEAIHIDNVSTEGEPLAKPIDGTINDKITVKNCVLDNVLSGIGQHVKDEYADDDKTIALKKTGSISILNNEFHSVKYICLYLYNKGSATLRGNKVYLFGQFLVSDNITNLDSEKEKQYEVTSKDKKSMRALYERALKSIQNYSFPQAGKKVSKYQYFLRDINGDGIREMIVAANFTGKDKKTVYRDCIIFTCRKASGTYTLKQMYGDFVADTLYIAADKKGLLNKKTAEDKLNMSVDRITISSNTLIQRAESKFQKNSASEKTFINTNQKVVWLSTSNTAALSVIHE